MGEVTSTVTFTYSDESVFREPFHGTDRREAKNAVAWTRRSAEQHSATKDYWVFAALGSTFRVRARGYVIVQLSRLPVRARGAWSRSRRQTRARTLASAGTTTCRSGSRCCSGTNQPTKERT